MDISSMLNITIKSQKGKTVSMFVVLAFAVAGLTAVTSLSNPSMMAQGLGNVSNPSVVAQLSGLSQHPHLTPGNVSDLSVARQSPENNPNDCFQSNPVIDTCPIHSHFKGLSNNATDCFKIIGEAKVSTGDVQNYTKSVQNFFSLLHADNRLTSINKNIGVGSGPITDIDGLLDLMNNGNMTRYDRQQVLNEIDGLLAAAKSGFSPIQRDALSLCFTTEANSLGPTSNY